MRIPSRVKALTKTSADQQGVDRLGMWTLGLGAVGVGLALLVYFAGGESIAASFALVAAAAIIGLVLRESERHSDID